MYSRSNFFWTPEGSFSMGRMCAAYCEKTAELCPMVHECGVLITEGSKAILIISIPLLILFYKSSYFSQLITVRSSFGYPERALHHLHLSLTLPAPLGTAPTVDTQLSVQSKQITSEKTSFYPSKHSAPSPFPVLNSYNIFIFTEKRKDFFHLCKKNNDTKQTFSGWKYTHKISRKKF